MLDASVTLAWAFEDEADDYADAVLDALEKDGAVVPGIWGLEVANVPAVGERRERLTPADSARFLVLLQHLSLEERIGEVRCLDDRRRFSRRSGRPPD
ncbi:MAG: type II toxin-antitoxin system VapC family toxin [Rubrobacter sp.]|nr:type II toxin-antitoxin system VapC family toxin [Rubrobacter sp.]